MSETQIIKVVFSIFLSSGSAVLLLIAFKLYYKYLVQEKNAPPKRSEQSCGIHCLPAEEKTLLYVCRS